VEGRGRLKQREGDRRRTKKDERVEDEEKDGKKKITHVAGLGAT
jgi:hypothetical protein